MRTHCFASTTNGFRLFIKLTPNARQDEILGIADGMDGPVLAIKICAIPEKGKANKALIKLIARWVGVSKSDIELISGQKSRLKTLSIFGEFDNLEQQVTSLIERNT